MKLETAGVLKPTFLKKLGQRVQMVRGIDDMQLWVLFRLVNATFVPFIDLIEPEKRKIRPSRSFT